MKDFIGTGLFLIGLMFFGGGNQCLTDTDGDGVADFYDNCVDLSNSDQQDSDGDRIGDACQTFSRTYGLSLFSVGNSVTLTEDGWTIVSGSACQEVETNDDLTMWGMGGESEYFSRWEYSCQMGGCSSYGGRISEVEGVYYVKATKYCPEDTYGPASIGLGVVDPDSFEMVTFLLMIDAKDGFYPADIIKTVDGNYVVVGTAAIDNSLRWYIQLVDGQGGEIWTKVNSFDPQNDSWGDEVVELADGNFMVMAFALDKLNGNYYNVHLYRTDSNGNFINMIGLGLPPQSEGRKMIATSNGGVALIMTQWEEEKLIDYLVQIPPNTDDISFIDTQLTIANSIVETNDGKYIVVGDQH